MTTAPTITGTTLRRYTPTTTAPVSEIFPTPQSATQNQGSTSTTENPRSTFQSDAAQYALAKQIPDIADRGCTINTSYGDITVEPGTMAVRLAKWLQSEISHPAPAHDERDEATQQAAFNALSTAQWYVARNQPAAALARMRRAKSHITAMMEGSTQ